MHLSIFLSVFYINRHIDFFKKKKELLFDIKSIPEFYSEYFNL